MEGERRFFLKKTRIAWGKDEKDEGHMAEVLVGVFWYPGFQLKILQNFW